SHYGKQSTNGFQSIEQRKWNVERRWPIRRKTEAENDLPQGPAETIRAEEFSRCVTTFKTPGAMRLFPKSPADWSEALFRFGFCCIAIDVAAEFFLFFNYVDGLRPTVREWQSILQMIGLWVSGVLLLWSFPLLRTSTDHRSLHY